MVLLRRTGCLVAVLDLVLGLEVRYTQTVLYHGFVSSLLLTHCHKLAEAWHTESF